MLQSCKDDVTEVMAQLQGAQDRPPRIPLTGVSGFPPRVIFADFPEDHESLKLIHDLQSELCVMSFSFALQLPGPTTVLK